MILVIPFKGSHNMVIIEASTVMSIDFVLTYYSVERSRAWVIAFSTLETQPGIESYQICRYLD